jgi:hypothetical protein
MTRKHLIAPLALAAVLGACLDNETILPPTGHAGLVDPMFANYMAFGNSITAGLQSGGINDSTQMRSYAVLLAEQMGLAVNGPTGGSEARAVFNVPLLNRPGCPPPFKNIFTQEVVGDPGPLGCALRNPTLPPYLNNVAWPGADIIEAYDYFDPGIVPSETDAFRSFLLGGRTELDWAKQVQPTFATVWLGNNDVLSAILDEANPGNPAGVTDPADFAVQLDAFLAGLDSIGTIEGGVLIGAVQAGLAPYLTQGRVWKGFEQQFDALTAPLNAFDVNNNCLSSLVLPTGDTAWVSVPFAVGGPKLALAKARVDSVLHGTLPPQNLVPVALNCSVDADVVTAAEMANMFGAVAQFNAAIEQAATDRDWIYIDPNDLLLQLLQDPEAIRRFPAFPGTVVDPDSTRIQIEEPFGWALSLDGLHPSSATHVLVANALIVAINAKYGTSIPAIP